MVLRRKHRLARLWELVSFFFQAEDGIRDYKVTGVQTCALPISKPAWCLQKVGCIGSVAVRQPVGRRAALLSAHGPKPSILRRPERRRRPAPPKRNPCEPEETSRSSGGVWLAGPPVSGPRGAADGPRAGGPRERERTPLELPHPLNSRAPLCLA